MTSEAEALASAGLAASGATIGRYELVSRLGAGGMGEVFLARATGAGGFAKDVVIKRILPHLANDAGFVQRFIEEGKLVVRLRHAGIAQVLDMGEHGGVYFIAMEHVDGKDLGELMRIAAAGGQRMPVPLAVHVLVALLDALDYAHRAKDGEGRPLGIIHRDVSPSNVMLATTGEVKLLDFGIARATERLQASTTGAIRGKYSYMSPQQAAGLELDARSDLFSVGVIAWELLTGERPFDGPSDLLTLDRIRFHDPGSVRARAPSVPEDLAAIVERLLAKTPEARFASADEAARALRAHVMKSGTLATSRDLAEWVEGVLATLPRALRERSTQGLSIDELLRLGLGSDPGGGLAPSTPGTVAGGGTVAAGGPRATIAPLGRPDTMMAPPSPAPSPLPAALPTTTPAPIAAQAPAGKSRLAVFLVAVNLVLIALVLVLVLRSDDDLAARPIVEATRAPADALAANEIGAVASTAPPMTTTTAADAGAPTAVPHDAATAGDATPVEVIAPQPEARPGAVAGAALAGIDAVFAAPASLTIRAVPSGALVAVNGFGSGRAPRTIEARPGTRVSVRVTAPDHEARAFEAVVGDDESITVTLKPVPQGTVHFKFFPAEGTSVEIDGKRLVVASNTVSHGLTVGAHTLVLVARDGRRLVKSFEILEGQTRSLGTLDLGKHE